MKLNVRYWHLADIPGSAALRRKCLLLTDAVEKGLVMIDRA
jgi:hypothetical protein